MSFAWELAVCPDLISLVGVRLWHMFCVHHKTGFCVPVNRFTRCGSTLLSVLGIILDITCLKALVLWYLCLISM